MIGSLLDKIQLAFGRFKNDKEYSELVRTSSLALLVRMVGVITGFFVTVFTTRFYGADALGIVAICIAILSFASVFGKFGLDVALMKYVAEFSVEKKLSMVKAAYIAAMKVILPISFLISLILFYTADFISIHLLHKPYLKNLLQVNAWLTLPLVLILVNSECVRGFKKIKTYTFFQTVSVSLIAMFLLFILSYYYSNKEIPTYIQFLSIAITGCVSTFVWFHYSGFLKVNSASEFSTSTLLKISSPMFLTTLMQLIMSWAGTLILAAYNTDSDVGVYNALIRISVFTNVTILAINSLAMPRFVEAFSSGKILLLEKNAKEAARLILFSAIPAFVLLFFFPHFILSIFGKEFPGNEMALYVLLVGQLIVASVGLPSQLLNMTGRQSILRNIALVSALINVIACLLLIPHFGLMGACIAQVIGIFAWNLLSVFEVKRRLGFFSFFNPFS